MANKKLDKFKKLVSQDKSGWLDKANWRKENEEWLDVSFKIAVRIMSALKLNKVTGTFPKNQKELSDALDCTPQYISKLLKGQERLGIDTISKIGKIIGVKLIDVPTEDVSVASVISNPTSVSPQYSQVIESKGMSLFDYKFNQLMNERNNLQSSYDKLIEESIYARDNNSHLKVA
jgi:transcriptional regulator with XRE-family HTH domain